MKYRSPLSRARGWGSSGHGAHHWTMQRFSAVALAPLGLWFAFSLAGLPDMSFETFENWLARPWVPALLALFFAVAYYHAALGVQVVIEDYIHSEFLRNALLIALRLVMMVMAVFTIVSVLLVSF